MHVRKLVSFSFFFWLFLVNAGPTGNPVIEIKGTDNPLLKHAFYHPDYKVLHIPDIARRTPPSVSGEKLNLNPRAFTVTTWVMPRNTVSGYRMIAFKGNRYTAQMVDFKFGFYNQMPEFAFVTRSGVWQGILATDGSRKSQKRVIPNRWNFLAATFDNGKMKIFLNGEENAVGETRIREIPFSDMPLWIGYGQSPGNIIPRQRLDGLVDRFKLYAEALSPEEIEQIRLQEQSFYPTDVVKLKPLKKIYATDKGFTKKLDIVKEYEKNIPESDLGTESQEMTVVRHAGIPMAARNGAVESIMCMLPGCAADNREIGLSCRDFAAAGVNYSGDTLWPFIKWGNNCFGWWLAPGKYDFKKIENRFQALVDANPRVRLLIRIKLNVPKWWVEQYPDELALSRNGKKAEQPSISSEKWLNDVCHMTEDVVHFLENSKLGPHIIGYTLGGGSTSEWFWWGYRNGMLDFSPANRTAFRKWLKERYQTDEALQKAWNDPGVALASADIPLKNRMQSEDGVFRDIRKSRPASDFRVFMSEMIYRAITRSAQAVRRQTKTRKLIGTFYGYAQSGDITHQHLRELLKGDEIDFFTAPTSYTERLGGQSGAYYFPLLGSLKLHNKIYWDEADLRTHLSREALESKMETPEETREVLWRSFGNALTRGAAIWWLLISQNEGFHDNAIMNQMQAIARLDRELLDVSRDSAAEIAVFRDERSSLRMNPGQNAGLAMESLFPLPYVGAPSDVFLISDIDNPRLKNYKLYIFQNLWYVTDELREKIHAKLKKNHAAALWIYAPGYLSPEGASLAKMQRLTGFRFRKYQRSTAESLRIAVPESVITKELGFSAVSCNPAFSVDDPDAAVLAVFGRKKNGLALKKTEWGTSIYSGVPFSAGMLRGLCRKLGIHLYNESGDVLEANRSFIMLHAVSGGEKTIRLPKKTRVRNLRNNRIYPLSDCLSLSMQEQETVLFQMLDPGTK